MKLICKYLGGSHSYGLNTINSDIDNRGVYISTNIGEIIGIDKNEQTRKQGNGIDEVYTELRQAFKLLRNGNSQMIECLYNTHWLLLDDAWKAVIEHRNSLLDSAKLFNCLRGYMKGEFYTCFNGINAKLGLKRKESFEKYGFCPKNLVNYIRLSYCGQIYFSKGYYPVNIKEDNITMWQDLYTLKTNPQFYTIDHLKEKAIQSEKDLVYSFENRLTNTVFDVNIANKLSYLIYKKELSNFNI